MASDAKIKIVAMPGMPEDAAMLVPNELTPAEEWELRTLVAAGCEYGAALGRVLGRKAAVVRFAAPRPEVDHGE